MSMDSTYAVDWNIQNDGVGSIGNAISALDSELSQINTDGNALKSTWESASARAAYDTRQKQWDDAGTQIKQALEKFKTNLGASAEIAQGAEKQNTNILSA
ncbi:hypothetical protein EK0264_11635 [Epidermidibacterium keratini]|uniref:WXG100 family type VII secretion target n=1 Tax=Epidermidibacterium keratini TaxID=1891644 RepID=A0A7L4YNL0_9ACTN|nr:WXG100 family type VII secretion target [Epidermidibacterium keratini]QHC00871.1 hypothetical protein EK0264_11635 [Epidermidibacterium keratini]